jgi:hypothetical protein
MATTFSLNCIQGTLNVQNAVTDINSSTSLTLSNNLASAMPYIATNSNATTQYILTANTARICNISTSVLSSVLFQSDAGGIIRYIGTKQRKFLVTSVINYQFALNVLSDTTFYYSSALVNTVQALSATQPRIFERASANADTAIPRSVTLSAIIDMAPNQYVSLSILSVLGTPSGFTLNSLYTTIVPLIN